MKPPSRKILLWKKADSSSLRQAIQDFSSDFNSRYSQDTDINILWQTFRDFVGTTIQTNVPSKMTSTRFSQPWISRKAKRSSRRKKRAFRRAKATGSDADIDRYKQACKDTRYECRKAYNTYIGDMVTTDRNPKKLYSLVKGKRCDSSGVSPLKSGGLTHSDPATKATILNSQFSSVFTQEDTTNIPSLGNSPYPAMHNFSIGIEGVRKLLADLDSHKSTGPDNIPTRFLKEYADDLAPALTLIFSASVSQGEVPKDWRDANVTPIFKKGDHSDPANYRPISLTSVCSKLIEHILHSQIMTHLDSHRILTDQQHGFRKRRSTESQLILTLHDLAKGLDEGEQIDAILLDFSKAFDKVPHERLASKLEHYGIRGNLLLWIKSFLAHRTQQVLVEGRSSDTAPVTSGVPQGSVIGPLLFLLYINDLPLQATSTTRLFADDSLLYRKIRSTQDAQALQDDLDRLQKWEEDWLMSFNPSKCEVVRITRKRNPFKTTYQAYNTYIGDMVTT
ncbi:MAG: reverse transcriptase family protein, partial [Candidatus Thiodiazotropha taylori]|nr:reverse transcriptase family protein [Candidatus Thiodiazotropha taylori]MCW4310122.1 reverse transcriptase family protein [Candidatus Thiodiazotropha endolucinida]